MSISKVIAELEKAINRDKELDAAFQSGARAMQEACAKVAEDRKEICFDAASKYRKSNRESISAQSEQCAGMEASHIADAIRALDPASLVRGE